MKAKMEKTSIVQMKIAFPKARHYPYCKNWWKLFSCSWNDQSTDSKVLPWALISFPLLCAFQHSPSILASFLLSGSYLISNQLLALDFLCALFIWLASRTWKSPTTRGWHRGSIPKLTEECWWGSSSRSRSWRRRPRAEGRGRGSRGRHRWLKMQVRPFLFVLVACAVVL